MTGDDGAADASGSANAGESANADDHADARAEAGDGATDDAIAPEEAFAVLGDETRLAILRELADRSGETVGFNELRKAVGARDSSGFNYHLRKLVGRFVRKEEDGYELTTAGGQVYGAILSGAYTDSVELDPIELTAEGDVCPDCGGPLQATYEDERMSIGCRECERVVASSVFPPAAVEGRPPERLPEAFGNYITATMEFTRRGLCSLCSGHLTGRLEITAMPTLAVEEAAPMAVFECDRCFFTSQASPGHALTSHPAVVSFFHERGVDVRDVPPWRLDMLSAEATTVVNEDPLLVAVAVREGGDELVITLDEDLDVIDVEGPRTVE